MKPTSKWTELAVAVAVTCSGLAACESLSFAPRSHDEVMAQANLRRLVVAELGEARRLGLITLGEESVPSITEAQSRLLALAVEGATVGEVIGQQ